MILKQYYLGCLAHASYLIADEETRTAVVVDPQRDIDQYLADAREHGWTIRHVFLTHFHADFLAGHLELRDRAGAGIHLGAEAQAEYDFTPVRDGDCINFGKVRLEVLETPGHTPEGISLLVYDLDKDDSNPHAVLTGDTLFIGDVGRPDLMASVGISETELASKLYDSLHDKLLKLPDATLVYPAHGAGSMCGKNLSTDTVSTMGAQRRHNYALQPMSKEEFIRLVTAGQNEAPAYFSYNATLNKQERETLDRSMARSLKGLPLQDVLRLRNQGAHVLDVRDATHYSAGHLVGSTHVGLDGKFATWAGTVLDPETPIVVLAEPGQEEEAILRLGRIGFDQVTGYLEGGMQALNERPDLVRRTERITADDLAEQLADPEPPVVLDVRSPNEHESGAIKGSLHIPLNYLRKRSDELPQQGRLVIYCGSGYRSSIAASILEQEGWKDMQDLVGGFAAWQKVR